MAGVILRRWLLGTALNMAGHEGNHVVNTLVLLSRGLQESTIGKS